MIIVHQVNPRTRMLLLDACTKILSASVMSTSQDPIRRMIACWAALDIVELRKHSAFMELFRNYGDFAVDIMEWVSCGSKPKDFYNISHE